MKGLLQAVSITRHFGPVIALDSVNFTARPGEIHALLGENGAGKTTLMHVIAGHLRPDGGVVMLDGVSLRSGSPQVALRAGIATVHQSPMLFERLSVAENLAMGGFVRRGLALDEVAQKASVLARSLGFSLPSPDASLEELSIAQRMRLEILRALSFEPRVLMLDEPTGLLAPEELNGFLELLRSLRNRGRSVVLITHKLGEAMAVADRITMLRAGRIVEETAPAQTTVEELAANMVGGALPIAQSGEGENRLGDEILRIDRLGLEIDGRTVLDRISIGLRAGEILAIAGVDGNGQQELTETLAGVRAATRGRILVSRAPADCGATRAIAVIPQNRDREGLILDLELWENLLLEPALRRRMQWFGIQRRAAALALCDRLIQRFAIRARNARQKAVDLSGGHRQRLMAARAIAARPAVLVAHDLTRGLDVRAAAEMARTVREYADQGGAVLLISTDLDEVFHLGDRVAVISNGRLFEVAPEHRTAQHVGLLMSGAAFSCCQVQTPGSLKFS